MARERYIDIVKGIAIWGIVLSHYEEDALPNSIRICIGSFMVMVFYISSGWISSMKAESTDLKQFVQKRWKQLMIPYLWWTTIILVFNFILLCFGYYDIQYIGKEIYKTITLRGIGTLWFLPALFMGELLWNYLKTQKIKLIISLLFVAIYIELYNMIFSDFPKDSIHWIINAPFRSIDNMLVAFWGVMCGHFAFHFCYKFKNPIASFIIGLSLCCIGYISLSLMINWPLILRLICTSISTSIGLFMLFKPLQNIKLWRFFEYWGRNSLNLMVTHYSIVLILFKITVENYLGYEFIGNITIIAFVLSIPIQWLLIPLISKYANFTLGK